MNWGSTAQFLSMGGYAVYVWGSFGVVALAIACEAWLVAQRRAASVRALRRQVLGDRLEQQGGAG